MSVSSRSNFEHLIRQHARTREILVIGPSMEAARHLLRGACDRALIGVHASTLKQYARDLTRSGPTPINDIVHQAICARIAATEKLTYFAPVAGTPGFPKALARTIKEIRLHGAQPAGDLGTLLSAYERELQERNLADDALIFRSATSHPAVPVASLAFSIDAQSDAEQKFLDWLAPLESLQPQAAAEPENALQSLQKYLFSEQAAPTRAADDSFRVFAAVTEAQESFEIARAVLDRVRSGARFDQCGIFLRQPERYAPLIAEAFRRAGIPVWFARGALGPDTAGRALLVLLRCAQEGLSAARIGEYLSLRHVPELNPVGWERIVTNAHVIGGVERWRRRLNAVTRESQTLDQLKAFVLPLIDRLHKLPQQAFWGEWLDVLSELAEAAIRENSNLIDVLDELRPMSDIGPIGIDEVIQLLSEHLRTSRLPDGEQRYGKVWVGSIEQARGFEFLHAFVAGMAEGVFPRPLREDPLLLDNQRRSLGMRETSEHQEQRLLHHASLCATRSLTLSYGRIDLENGRQRVPSLYIYAALRAAGIPSEISTAVWPGANPIDDFEYDTVALASKAPGSGAYLKLANTKLYDVLLARYHRWDSDSKWHSADGLNLLDSSLSDYSLTKHAYSVSMLEAYAACPYKFFLRAMLRLHPVETPEPLQRMDPAVRGSLFHQIQFEALRELRRSSLLPVTPENLANALERLDAVLVHVGAQEAERLAPALERVWNEEISRIRIDLRGWLGQMAEDDAGWTPIAFELAFGRQRDELHDERSVEDPVRIFNRYLLQGSVDLVERHAAGHLRVTDHKTGSFPQSDVRTIGKGEVLQPALYAAAVEAIFGETVGSSRLYYPTVRANFRSAPILLPNQNAPRVLQAINVAIEGGLLPANPREDACEHCDYRCVCGPYEEERVRRKPKDSELAFIRRIE